MTYDGTTDRVVIRSYPKIVFLYPTLLAAIACGIWTWAALRTAGGDLDSISLGPGRLFFAIFAFNFLVLTFDFTRKSFVAVVLLVLLVITFGFLIEARVPVFLWLESFLSLFLLRAHHHFYLAIAFILLFLIGTVVFSTRFTFWEVRSNEILHYQGFMADVDRYPAPGLRFRKHIPDVFEYVLFRSGTIVLTPAGSEKHVIENVPNVDRVEQRLDKLLGTIVVQIQGGGPGTQEGAPSQGAPLA